MAKKKQKRRNPKSRQGKLQQFAKKMKQDGILGNKKLILNPVGEVKMSDVLGQVIKPYIKDVDTLDAYHKLVALGALAWNNSLLPPEEQGDGLAVVDTLGLPPADKEIMKDLLVTLMKRKQALFPDIHRFIVDFEVSDLGNQWHLSVAATMQPEEK